MGQTIWAIIPAAGSGARLKSDVPKQYLKLNKRPILKLSIESLQQDSRICSVGVGIAANDHYFATLQSDMDDSIWSFIGGATRRDTVFNGLKALENRADENDWVLVHDAARPLLSKRDLSQLIDHCLVFSEGGLLAAPSVDTLKTSKDGRLVDGTLERNETWRALTPQCFRFGILYRALKCYKNATDESQAVEALGEPVALVVGEDANLKITHNNDLAMAEFILNHKGQA